MSARVRVWSLLVLAVAGIALTVSLGNWQLRRAAQKLAIEARWEGAERAPAQRLTAREIPAPQQLPLRVRLRGQFDHQRSVWLANRQVEARPGFWIVTPMRLDDGGVILVNRGWTARDAAAPLRRPAVGEPGGVIEIEGLAITHAARLLELGEGGNAGPLPAVWQNLEYEHYEAVSGLQVARLLVQQTSELDDGLVRRWARPASGVDKHRGYAFQWYSLSALIALLTVFFGVRAWRARRPIRSTD